MYILDSAFFECSESAGVRLPPSDGVAVPSLIDIKSIDINLLSSPLDLFIFRRLPLLLAQCRDQVQWHFNSLCKTCKFAPSCEKNTVEAGRRRPAWGNSQFIWGRRSGFEGFAPSRQTSIEIVL
ncbi:hypothetical protein Ac2012v2_005138 [Leucoagaricus gongylophorus]